MIRSWLRARKLRAQWAILDVLEHGVEPWWYGLALMRRARLRSARFYPAVDELMKLGLVEDTWDIPVHGQRSRRMYRLVEHWEQPGTNIPNQETPDAFG